jgi:hypothetical protein
MRTTVDLPDDLDRITRAIAADTKQTLSETIALLIRRGLGEPTVRLGRSERTGLPVIRLGRIVASEDVRSLEDEG